MICEGSPTSCEFIQKTFEFVFVLNPVQNGRNILKIDGTNIIDHQREVNVCAIQSAQKNPRGNMAVPNFDSKI